MPHPYIAITIGPIYKTFQNVRKTRELWAASYTFSFISKRIIEGIKELKEDTVLLPYYNKQTPKGIGLYPDRIFVKKSDTVNIEAIENVKDSVINEVSQWSGNGDSNEFLRNYFRIYSVEYSTSDSENPVSIGNELLDTAELRNLWELEESKNELLSFFRAVNKIPYNDGKWIVNHFEQKDVFNEIRFESLPEISTRAIRNIDVAKYKELVREYCYKDTTGDEEGFIKKLKKELNKKGKPENFKNYHKYIAIIKADGDKVGAYIKAIKSDFEKDLTTLSKSLHEWGIESAGLIKEYSGIPIYIGGDDVLFLAPIVGNNKQSILGLIKNLNESFQACFKALPERKGEDGNVIKPTLSFGLSITYYKYPLYEALNKANQLLDIAKKTRNACSISLLKHSGSSFDISISNDDSEDVGKSFQALNTFFIDDKSFVASIIHHFRNNEAVYRNIGNNKEKARNFLLNNFDNEKHEQYVSLVADLCHSVYTKNCKVYDKENKKQLKEGSEKSIKEIHSLLRILKFLNGQDDGK
jgi:CRISPR-associated protein Cmr2